MTPAPTSTDGARLGRREPGGPQRRHERERRLRCDGAASCETTSGTISFLNDGGNVAQELVGRSPTANALSGDIDEVFQRTGGTGPRAVLTDALGSTVALLDASGAVQTQYTYEPFGATSTSGAVSANPAQYTGRENDGAGLYYYRARYYDPNAGRFISEDPIGFEAGINFYSYAFDSPINLRDPSGKSAATVTIPISGGIGTVVCFGSGVCETVIIVGGIVVGVAATGYLIYDWYESRSRGHSDPIPWPGTKKPGRCDKEPGKCNPCPPDSAYWDQPGNAHGGTTGVHFHWYHWNQRPYPDCTCFPQRMDGGTPPIGGTPWSPGGQP